MIRKIAIANIRAAFCKLVAVVLVFSSTSPAFEWPTPSFGDDSHPVYAMKPDKGAAGGDHYVTVFSPDCKKQEINENTKLVSSSNISISEIKAKPGCSLTARISIPKDTGVGRLTFLLENKDKDNKDFIIGTTEFEVTGLGRGPIPEGLDPQVDVMWGVMPTDIVHHNFGRQIAKHYYGIQIRIGNNSGYDLQIAGIGFKLPESGIKNIVPTNSYRATRGTLEREQQIGLRATVMNIVKSLGSLYSGFLPFWHMPNRRANAILAGEILSGPFQTGLEIVFPDTTVRQLTRLDDQTLRDGLIVKNNSQVVTLAWVPKQILHLSKDSGRTDTTDKRPAEIRNAIKNWKDDPQYVNLRLGELVLVGQQISYINRVQVISTSEGGAVTPPPSVIGTNIQSAKQGEKGKEIIFSGDFLINPTIAGPTGIEFPSSEIKIDKNAHILRAKMNIAEELDPGTYNLTVTTEGGQKVVAFTIDPAPPEITDSTPKSIKATDKEQKVPVTLTGKFLKGGKLTSKKVDNVLEVMDDATASSTKITQTIRILPNAVKGDQTLELKAQGGTKSITLKIE